MPADKRHHPVTPPHNPPPLAGAHHGPGDTTEGVAETFGRFKERLKKSGVLSYRVLGVLVAVLVAVFVWQYLTRVRSSTTSREWVRLEQAGSLGQLDAIAKDDAKGMPGKLAELHEARYRLGGPDQGLEGLQQSDPARRKEAIDNVEKARESFKSLADVFKGDLVLRSQCLQGQAEAEEALIGIPKDGSTQEFRGSVEKAAELYDALAATAGPTTPVGERAKKYAETLRQKSNEIKSLQIDLNNRLTVKPPTLDPFHPPATGGGPLVGPGPISGIPGGEAPRPPSPPVVPGPKVEAGPPAPKTELPPRTPDPSVAPILPPSPPPTKK